MRTFFLQVLMDSIKNSVAPKINRARTLEIFSAKQLAEFAEIGITPNQVVEFLAELLPEDQTISAEFLEAVKMAISGNKDPNRLIASTSRLTRIFKALREGQQSELPAKVVELRRRARLQIASLLKQGLIVIEKIKKFQKKSPPGKKFRFCQINPSLELFFQTHRGTSDPAVVLPEVLDAERAAELLARRPHEEKVETPAGTLVLKMGQPAKNWRILNAEIHNTGIRKRRVAESFIQSNSKEFPRLLEFFPLNAFSPKKQKSSRVIIQAEQEKIKLELMKLQKMCGVRLPKIRKSVENVRKEFEDVDFCDQEWGDEFGFRGGGDSSESAELSEDF